MFAVNSGDGAVRLAHVDLRVANGALRCVNTQLARGSWCIARVQLAQARTRLCLPSERLRSPDERLCPHKERLRVSLSVANILCGVDSGSGAVCLVNVDLRVVSGVLSSVYRHLARGKCGIARLQLAQCPVYLAPALFAKRTVPFTTRKAMCTHGTAPFITVCYKQLVRSKQLQAVLFAW